MAAPTITESKCGKCGYRVTGLPTFQCPECGSDLRDVGILKQETKAGHSTPARGELSTFDYRGFSSSTTFSATSIIGVSAAGVIFYLLMVRSVLRKALAEGKAAMIAQGQWEEEPPVEKKAASQTLTVIFVDLKDFTGQAATISRARLLALLRQQRLMVEKAIAPFEGKIIKTMGDGTQGRTCVPAPVGVFRART